MQLHEAAKIVSVYDEELVNDNLSKGWKLLAITSGTFENERQPCYIMGKPAKTIGMKGSVIEVPAETEE
ncbi:hypothetical protein JM49_13570 [Pseudomonas chlororaphis subsp. aurantiaca]|uniref:hypothetical protein n=1 Tax=Pseudomonas chlororaphis TaxID=587753 RepID=UPI00050D6269|nr:hypothetical protein [Pseudomonas chlororaphis]AIS12663.1 hypothetical protein JM49_13570 [Pseudomonas chlororaphis subsp. aurantiaca]